MTVYTSSVRLSDLLQDATPTGTLNAIIDGVTVTSGDYPYTLSALDGKGDLIFPSFTDFIQYDDKGVDINRPPSGDTLALTFTLNGSDGSLTGTQENVTLTLTGDVPGLAPDAFASGGWALNDVPSVSGDKLEINVITLPSDNGDAITALKYQVDSGSGFGAAQTLSGTGTGARTITVLANTAADVRLWAENVNGAGDNLAAGANKTQTPTTLAGGEPTAHTTVANASALNTLLTQLESSYDVTVAANGGTAGEEFYIDCTAGSYSSATLSNRSFAHVVHIRAAGFNGACTLGATTISNSHNMRVAYFDVTNSAGSGITLRIQGGCSNVTFSHLDILCHPTYGSLSTGSLKHGVYLEGNTGRLSDIRIEYCLIRRAGENAIQARQVDNLYINDCQFDECGADDVQIKDIDGGIIERNWGTVRHRAPSAAHMDGYQLTIDQATGIGVSNLIIRKNVVADWNDPNPTSLPYRQNQCGDYNHVNVTVTDNIFIVGNTNGINLQGGPWTVTNNLFWRLNGTTNIHGTTHAQINGSTNGTFDANVEMVTSTSGSASRSGSTDVDNTDAARLTYVGDLRTGGDSWTVAGVGGDFSDMYPKAAQTLHWNHASKTGPWNRLQEVFVTGIHPGNDGYPTATYWDATHNVHGRITS